MDDAGRIDSQQVAVIRQVVDSTEREAVDDASDPVGCYIGNNVGCLNELPLS